MISYVAIFVLKRKEAFHLSRFACVIVFRLMFDNMTCFEMENSLFFNRFFPIFNFRYSPFLKDNMYQAWLRGYETFSILNSAEQELYPAHKC